MQIALRREDSRNARNTTVVMIRTMPKATLIDLESTDLPLLQEQMDKHFSRYKRK